ncbi:MAG TPA: M43 family zinc metalloprotease, partial [Chitinophagaceae bacterium]|nr:M43 family zinc metalloprotease [Chitinophagaceae bacterium]
MKKSTFLLVAGLFLFIGANAQSPQRSCNVYEMQEAHFQQDPSARARYAQTQAMIEQFLRENPQARTQAIINVPVVVHVCLPAAQQALVTDAIIQGQIDTLNFYYGGSTFNTDSLRVYTPFRTTYGRSEIRFCLAKRTPGGLATNGINRIVTNNTYTGGAAHPGELASWTPASYLNMWVVNGASSGLLGYAYKPGAWGVNDSHQGFVNDYRAWGAGPGISSGGYHFNEYNGGKTAVHEIGHYFNLDHPWGPVNDPPGNPTCTLSDQCADTPPTDHPFFGCPSSFPVTNPCSPSAPGIMWQNHMDYADDRCMILFTKDQCTRMMTAITTAADRVGLITSNGCQPPAVLNNDIKVGNILFPLNNSTTVCNPIVPQVTVVNNGTNIVSSYRINVVLNNGAVQFVDFPTANLAAGGSQNQTLTTLPQNLIPGVNVLKIYTSLPNGGADAVPANDTAFSTVTRNNGSTLPVVEGFEGAAYPPTGWTLNPGNTWQKSTPGNNSTFSSWGDFWGFSSGTTLTLTTPTYDVSASAGAKISFDVAHWAFSATTNEQLFVEVSNNCGGTFPSVLYNKTSNTGLSTVPGVSGLTEFVPSSSAQWRRESVIVPGAFVAPGTLNVRFRAISAFGNNVFIDNINIEKVFGRDLKVKTITAPGSLVCGAFAPVVVVENVGLEAISAFSVTYQVDGGATQTQAFTVAIAAGGTATVTLNNV